MPDVCLYVCLSVCMLAILRKNYGTDIRENFTTVVSVDKKELIIFLKSTRFRPASLWRRSAQFSALVPTPPILPSVDVEFQ